MMITDEQMDPDEELWLDPDDGWDGRLDCADFEDETADDGTDDDGVLPPEGVEDPAEDPCDPSEAPLEPPEASEPPDAWEPPEASDPPDPPDAPDDGVGVGTPLK